MQPEQSPETKPASQATPASQVDAEHHAKAAEFCNKAASAHTNAAVAHATGDKEKAGKHAEDAEDHCINALEHAEQASAMTGHHSLRRSASNAFARSTASCAMWCR
jgi:hypothetical protein